MRIGIQIRIKMKSWIQIRIKVKSWIRIRIKVMWIRNPVHDYYIFLQGDKKLNKALVLFFKTKILCREGFLFLPCNN
jgi:hypothetical protein